MELQGRVIKVLPITTGTKNDGTQWRKQEFVFGYYENPTDIYERSIKLDLMNEKIDEYHLQEGDKITVRIGLGCHEYPQGSGKYFNDIRTGTITVNQRAQ